MLVVAETFTLFKTLMKLLLKIIAKLKTNNIDRQPPKLVS